MSKNEDRYPLDGPYNRIIVQKGNNARYRVLIFIVNPKTGNEYLRYDIEGEVLEIDVH